ncbi:MAG: SRPBCC family protein [Proteobacteria bacterium]|nr:SRPBCC family protein [Pseudomonadota bacterium]
MSKKRNPNELNIDRVYNAPVKAVWDAWTDLEQVGKWWGPRGFTLTTHSKDLRPGGHWHYTMHGPDGVDYPNKTKYFEVETYSKLVYDHGGNDEQAPLFRVTVQFNERDGKTHMAMTMAFASPEIAAESKKFIKKASGDSTWDRLAEYLTKQTTGQEQFVINRSFAAPIDLMYEMWTKPKHFAKWMGPTGATMEFIRSDLRPGGTSFYRMDAGGGVTMFGLVHYLEMQKPHQLVYTQQFADKDENISRHPFAPIWPETMLTRVRFTEEDAGITRVTLIWEAYGKVTPEELQVFIEARAGMTGGWTGSFDKLEEYLIQQG